MPPISSRRSAARAVDVERRVVDEVERPRRRTRTVNKVRLTGRLTRDPELRSLASGKAVTHCKRTA
jgi:hypothetical protein